MKSGFLLDLDQGFVRRYAVAFLDMDADHDAVYGRLDFVFHLHGFDDQYAIACLDFVPDLDLTSIIVPGMAVAMQP